LCLLLGGFALAGPPMLETFNTTHPVVSFTDCNARAPRALVAMGLTVTGATDNQRLQDMWSGRSATISVTILCYPLGNERSAQVIVSAANEGSGADLAAFHRQLIQSFYATGAASQPTPP
jgi:hypothetical protein